MPANKNEQFETILNSPNLLVQPKAELEAALNALLAADLDDEYAFLKAVDNRREFWGKIDPAFLKNDDGTPYTKKIYLLSADDSPSFAALKRHAAEQRVILGLKDAADDVLIEILGKHNADECRAYLADKLEFGKLEDVPEWGANPAEVLSNGAIERIQKQAANLHLLNLIKDSENIDAMKRVLEATTDGQLQHAAIALGYPTDRRELLGLPISSDMKAALQELLPVVILQRFEEDISAVAEEDMLKVKSALEVSNMADFKDNLPDVAPFEAFKAYVTDEEQMKQAKVILAVRYIEVMLAKNKEHLVQAINSPTNEAVVGHLKKLKVFKATPPGNQEYLALGFDEAPQKLNVLIVQNIISHLEPTTEHLKILKAIKEAPGNAELVPQLKKLGISNPDWILDDDLEVIKEGVSQFPDVFLINKINTTEDQQLLMNLSAATTDEEIFRAAIDLGYPEDVIAQEFLVGHDFNVIKEAIEARLPNLAMSQFEHYVADLSDAQIIAMQPILEDGNDDNLREALSEPYKTHLPEDQLVWARGELGLRFFQARALDKSVPKDNLLAALNAPTNENLKDRLAEFPHPALAVRNTTYIANAVERHSSELRKALLHGVINSFTDTPNNLAALQAIDKAANLAQFKTKLKEIGVSNVDWVQDSDMADIKEWCRSHVFQIQLGKDRLGAAAHPQLQKAFSELPPENQRKLLETNKLQGLLNARDEHGVAHYLGSNDPDILKDVTDENKRLLAIKQIHNPEIAKILAAIPSIVLNQTKINAINEAIFARPRVNFDIPENVAHFANNIAGHCALPAGALHRAFGLNADGTAFILPDIKEAIKSQHEHNVALLDTRRGRNALNPELLPVLFRINKTADFTNSQLIWLEGRINRANNIRELFASFNTPPAYPPYPAGSPGNARNVQEELMKELTPEIFDRIKVQSAVSGFNAATEARFNIALDYARDALGRVKNEHKPLAKHDAKFNAYLALHAADLNDPRFQYRLRNEPDKVKKQFKDMDQQVDQAINLLALQKAHLQNYLDGIPTTAIAGHYQATRQVKMDKIRADIRTELNAVEQDLNSYLEIQQKLRSPDGILDAIEKPKQQLYQPDHFRFETYDEEDVPPLSRSPATSGTPTAAVVGGAGATSDFLLDEKLQKGKARLCFMNLVITEDTPGGGSDVVFQSNARYSERHDPTMPTVGNNAPPRRFVVDQPPEVIVSKPNDPKRADRTAKADIEFYGAMAVSLVAALDGRKPGFRLSGSNEKELRHLWTALVVLGEKSDPKFGPEAISISGPFNPYDEYTKNWRGKIEVKGALYKQYKAVNASAIVKPMEQAAHKVSSEAIDHKSEAKDAAKRGAKITANFKAEVDTIKLDALKKKLDEEGPAPIGPK